MYDNASTTKQIMKAHNRWLVGAPAWTLATMKTAKAAGVRPSRTGEIAQGTEKELRHGGGEVELDET